MEAQDEDNEILSREVANTEQSLAEMLPILANKLKKQGTRRKFGNANKAAHGRTRLPHEEFGRTRRDDRMETTEKEIEDAKMAKDEAYKAHISKLEHQVAAANGNAVQVSDIHSLAIQKRFLKVSFRHGRDSIQRSAKKVIS